MVAVLIGHETVTVPEETPIAVALVLTGLFGFVGQVFMTRGLRLERAGPAAVVRYMDVPLVFLWDAIFLKVGASL